MDCRVTAIGACCLLVVACSHAAPPGAAVTARIVGAGQVVAPHDETVPAPETLQGSVGAVPAYWTPDFDSGPDDVHARIGTSMGIEVLLHGGKFLDVVPLRTRVTHPPISDPDGRSSVTDEWDSPMNVGLPRYAGWGFEHPWELVPGTWRMELLLGERVLAAQTFHVVVDGK